ncbi:MAG: hypothetical protein STSR0009_26990 [Methanoregula sp.]
MGGPLRTDETEGDCVIAGLPGEGVGETQPASRQSRAQTARTGRMRMFIDGMGINTI